MHKMHIHLGLWLFLVIMLLLLLLGGGGGGGGGGCVATNFEGYGIEGSKNKSTTLLGGGLATTNSMAVVEKQQLPPLKELESGKKTSLKEGHGKEEPIGLIEKKKKKKKKEKLISNNKGAYLNEESDVKGLDNKKKNLSEIPSKEVPFVEKIRRNSTVGKGRATYEMNVYAGEGQFLAILRIGTPPVSFTAIVDTGSDLVWRQCKPCKQCYPQSAATTFPIFNPALSSTYHKASCSDPLCSDAQLYGSTCNRTCKYYSPYDDPPAYTRGDLAFDTLSISDVSGHPHQVAHFAFGCSHESHGPYNFAGAGGIVGFGQGKLSLPAQLGVKKFSYCLPRIAMWSISSLDTSLQPQTEQSLPSARSMKHLPLLLTPNESSSSLLPRKSKRSATQKSPSPSRLSPLFSSRLVLGEAATQLRDGPNIQSTRILNVSNDDFSYKVELQGISVGGRRLNISRSVFHRGGTIIDSGTTFTTLARQAFHAVYAAFTTLIPQKPTHVASPRNLSLCYSTLPWPLPSLSFHFRGARIHLPSNNYFIFIDNLYCLAILESHDSRCVYGNVQQQDFHILYDLHSRFISFKPTSCSPHQR